MKKKEQTTEQNPYTTRKQSTQSTQHFAAEQPTPGGAPLQRNCQLHYQYYTCTFKQFENIFKLTHFWSENKF